MYTYRIMEEADGNECSFKERIDTLRNIPQYFSGTMFV